MKDTKKTAKATAKKDHKDLTFREREALKRPPASPGVNPKLAALLVVLALCGLIRIIAPAIGSRREREAAAHDAARQAALGLGGRGAEARRHEAARQRGVDATSLVLDRQARAAEERAREAREAARVSDEETAGYLAIIEEEAGSR